jgi:hypothetical protein
VIDDGNAKYERNHMLAPSRSSRGAAMGPHATGPRWAPGSNLMP